MKLLTVLCMLLMLAPSVVAANEITVRPFLIDADMVARESLNQVITLSSTYPNRTAIVYATVNEINVDAAGEIKEFRSPVMTDRTNSVTSWIEITRGRIELLAGSSQEIPVTVKIHPFAEPGEYHAFIGFVETKKRTDAESIALAGDAKGVIVKITVSDERTEGMRISSMLVDRFVTNSDEQQVAIIVENAGEIASAPTGEIIFYNNRGFEVAALAVNEANKLVEPGEAQTFVSNIPVGTNLGRYKANVNLQYGQNQTASLFDSVGFFMLPMYYLYIGIGLLSLLLVVLFMLMRRDRYGVVADTDDVQMYVKDGHSPKPKHHDIDLSN